jgi:hypothetical protein
MYGEAGIEPLSKNQMSKLMNFHSVRVKPGHHHKVHSKAELLNDTLKAPLLKVHLSKEQMKKHHRAMQKGTGYTLTFDPYQKEMHMAEMHGRGTWTNLGHVVGNDLGVLANTGTNWLTSKMGGNTSTPTSSGSGLKRRGRPRKHMEGAGHVNSFNKFKKWTNLLGHDIQAIGNYIKPVAKPILQAATQRAVNQINPMSQAQQAASVFNSVIHPSSGSGLKKHRGRPRKHMGHGFVPPGVTAENMGYGLKRKSHRKKAMHFAL